MTNAKPMYQPVCVCCGRSDWRACRDNQGREYVGCKWCRLLTAEETQRLFQNTTVRA